MYKKNFKIVEDTFYYLKFKLTSKGNMIISLLEISKNSQCYTYLFKID